MAEGTGELLLYIPHLWNLMTRINGMPGREVKMQSGFTVWFTIILLPKVLTISYGHIIQPREQGALEEYYPGDEYVDVIGKSAYGTGLIFSEYEWAVEKKKNHGKVIWWAELGIRGQSEPPVDCFDVLRKLETSFPELAGFVFWSDDPFYNVAGNLNGPAFMADPKIVTLK